MQAADARHANPRLAAKLQSLYGLRGSPLTGIDAIDLSIRPPFYELLRRLGDPHKHLPPTIHVAGTNGKGSTIAFMRAIFEAAGYRAHVYTSPHLVRFNERIVLAGREIADDLLEALLDEVIAVNGDLAQTFFEIKTAMAFAAFARQPADILLLEVGMGGRLDSTNVIENPAVTVITPIGLDHQEFLGPDVAAIAGEKAGIMKPGVPCVVASQDDPATEAVFTERAAALGAPLLRAGREWRTEAVADGFNFHFAGRTIALPPPSLAGAHQVANAGTAIASLQCLPGFEIPGLAIAEGMRTAHWPGRLQKLAGTPDCELWVDGAHNEHGARALAAQFAAWQAQDNRPLHLIVGMLKRKNAEAFLAPLRPYAATVTGVPIAGEPECHDAHSLPGIAFLPDLMQAAAAAQARKGRVVICGSLYLAGEALSLPAI